MNSLHNSSLNMQAADQRQRISNSIAELKAQVRHTLEPERNVREHLGAACAVATLIGLSFGYSLAGIFTRR
jgi:hypothetical protein